MSETQALLPLYTPWGETVDHGCPHAEYPRPQLERARWQCLNGPWQYAILPEGDEAEPESWDGEILVPFSPECLLSGVLRQLLPGQRLWYRRSLRFEPMPGPNERLVLHFGAVDQRCTVHCNGLVAGSHAGGYWPFSFDITGLAREGENVIAVSVADDSDAGDEAWGKQKLNRGKIWYTGQSGIWQTVWCEVVPSRRVEALRITPCFGEAAVRVEVEAGFEGPDTFDGAEGLVRVLDGGEEVARAGLSGGEALISLPGFKPWTPDSPFLYDLEVSLESDVVKSYFGMREFGVLAGADGLPRLALNGKPFFHHGLLDQGYWSDGMYTPPSDEAMAWEIAELKSFGFNMLRKHIKIEPLRWYYHCDRLGMLVWQDFVSGGGPYSDSSTRYAPFVGIRMGDGPGRYALHGRASAEGRENFLRDARRTMDLLYNIVSLAVWVPFNEGWGQFGAAQMAKTVREADPTRQVDHASGWMDEGAGDFASYHIYFKRFRPKRDALGRVLALTEFGGYSLPCEGHMTTQKPYGYKMFSGKKALASAISALYRRDVLPAMKKGLSAAIYTQVSDVEDEVNGIFTADRRVTKLGKGRMRALAKLLHGSFAGLGGE